eukprot:Amastigsp_a555_137.p4 type:complete len:157 gc:universal Amastigsp_a555_137:895-425(-)
MRFAVDLDLVRLHHFLNRGADLGEQCVDASGANACVCCSPDGVEQRLFCGIVAPCPRRVDDAPVDVDAKVDFHDVARVEHRRVAAVWCVVRSTVVDRDSARERKSRVEPVLADEQPRRVFAKKRDIGEAHAGTNFRLRVAAHLTMHLGTQPHVLDP